MELDDFKSEYKATVGLFNFIGVDGGGLMDMINHHVANGKTPIAIQIPMCSLFGLPLEFAAVRKTTIRCEPKNEGETK